MRTYFILFSASLIIYLIHFAYSRHGVYGDGNGYFALAYTLAFHPTNLDFHPIYQYLTHFQGSQYNFSRIFWDTTLTKTGVINTPWLIGTAIFWIPSILLTSIIINFFHTSQAVSFVLFELAVGVTGILLIIGGLRFLELYLRQFVKHNLAAKIIVIFYLCTQLLYYGSFEPALSHQSSFFLICFILYICTRTKSFLFSFLLAAATGLLTITRMGDVVVIIPFILFKFFSFVRDKKYMYLLLSLIGFGVGIVPQLLLQKAMYGDFMSNPYIQGMKGVFQLISFSSLWNNLFSLRGGFLLWSPLMIVGLAGYFIDHSRKIKIELLLSIAALCIYTLLIACWQSWVPAGFGNRFFTSTIPLFALSFSQVLNKYTKATFAASIGCFLWNVALIVQFYI